MKGCSRYWFHNKISHLSYLNLSFSILSNINTQCLYFLSTKCKEEVIFMKLVVQEAPSLKAAIESIVSFTMPKSAFLEYNVDEERKIGIDIAQLSNVLARGKRGEKAELSIEEGRLVIKFYTEKRKRTFKVPLLEIGEGISREPKIEYNNHVKINAEALRDALKDAKLVSSHVKFLLETNAFTVD